MSLDNVDIAPTPSPLLLAAALSDPHARPDPARWTALARTAERARLDFVTVEAGPLDPLLLAARLAAQTERIGLVPVVSPTVTEPFHVSTALATIDVVSRGRAGWLAELIDADTADGLVTWDVPADTVADGAEHVEVVRRLWDSWEDGAEIRDGATARFIDRERVHHIDFRGEHLAVRGPSITPRPPQGHPAVAVRGHDLAVRASADVLFTADPEAPPTPGILRVLEVAVPAGGASRDLAERLIDQHARGFAGFLLHAEDLDGTLGALLPALTALGAPRPVPAVPPPTLRARLGLPAAANRYAVPATTTA
jgi:alkanesulfonate monooxygenase SsuD/methylene tetrahydromethanopterin reductase-like flavin-dependent oxidoreductase (luciferase family)